MLTESYKDEAKELFTKQPANMRLFIVVDTQPRSLVFIDELDHCRPDYVVNYLETINCIFEMHGVLFLL